MPADVLPVSSVCSIVVTYWPDVGALRRLQSLRARTAQLIVVDNASGDAWQDSLQELASAGAKIIRNDRNRGLAAALNQGLQEARQQGFAWALLSDQDSEMAEDLLDRYRQVLREQEASCIAVIGNNYASVVGDDRLPLLPLSPDAPAYHPAKAVITAGSLMSLAAYARVGPLREDFFIDWLDTEYCYRARRQGLQVWMMQQPLVFQRIGATERRGIAWTNVYASNHAPLRRYYMSRNLILLMKDYFFFEPVWFVGRTIDLVKTAIKILAFEKDKTAKLSAMAAGLRDGRTGESRYVPD